MIDNRERQKMTSRHALISLQDHFLLESSVAQPIYSKIVNRLIKFKKFSIIQSRIFLPLMSLLLYSLSLALNNGCDDPSKNTGPIGGLVLVIRSYAATQDPAIEAITSIEIETQRIEVSWSDSPSGASSSIVVDTQQRTILIANSGTTDRLVGQYQVPPGYVSEIRIFPGAVSLHLNNGTSIPFQVPSSNIPSWGESGWKIQPADGTPWLVQANLLTGVQAQFHFDDQMLYNKGNGYKIKPTVLAVPFSVNPPNNGPGMYLDQITVIFNDGVTRSQVDNINSQIGATILREPIASQAYRMKLPASKNLQDASNYYLAQPQVHSVLPAVNLALAGPTPAEGVTATQPLANLPNAWQTAFNRTGSIGSQRVLVANIDSPVKVQHADLVQNIMINQGEIPANIKAMITDVDKDGYITFYDLNNKINYNNQNIARDMNFNGCIDPYDLLHDIGPDRWINGIDDDNDATWNPKGAIVDDLIGYNFADNMADVSYGWGNIDHGTSTSLAMAAAANNPKGEIMNDAGTVADASFCARSYPSNQGELVDTDVAGAVWNVGLIPLVVASAPEPLMPPDLSSLYVPQEAVIDALRYVESKTFYNKDMMRPTNVDVANVELWYQVLEKGADDNNGTICSFEGNPETDSVSTYHIPPDIFSTGISSQMALFSVPPWVYNQGIISHVLYTWPAGNSGFDLSNPKILNYLSEPMRSVLTENFVMVGAWGPPSMTNGVEYDFMDGDSNYGVGVVDLWAPNGSTSLATPMVSGTAALLISLDPCVRDPSKACLLRGSPAELKHRLVDMGRAPQTIITSTRQMNADYCVNLSYHSNIPLQPKLDSNAVLQ